MCGQRYSRWTTPVSANGLCGDCFEAELSNEREAEQQKEDVSPAPITRETPARTPIVPIRWSSFLPRSRSKVVFVLVMGCYCIAVGSFMSTWTWVAKLPRPPRAFYLRGDVPDVLGLLIFGPLIESLFVVGVFELARRVQAPDWAQVFVSAVFISELHVWPWWPHAFIVLPGFLIESASYLFWRRTSWKDAFWVIVCIHALNNVIPALSAIGRAMRHA
jgi:hypothetical protein